MARSDPQKPVGRRDDPREVRIFLRVFLGFFGGMFLAVVAVVMLWSLTESRPTPDGSVFVITRRPPRDRLRYDPLMNDEEMKTRFLADGESRLRGGLEFQARLRELRESIQARHAAELAAAGFFRRLLLRWRIAAEFRRERRKIEPSPGSLYSSQTVARMPGKEEGS